MVVAYANRDTLLALALAKKCLHFATAMILQLVCALAAKEDTGIMADNVSIPTARLKLATYALSANLIL